MEQKRLERFIVLTIGGLTGFTYLLYLVGRTYTDAYLSTLKIPKDTMNYRPDDYMYAGAQPDTLVITLLFTSIFVGFLWYLFRHDAPAYRKGDLVIALGLLFYYALGLAAITMFISFNPGQAANPAIVMAMLVTSMIPAGISFMILLFDRGLTGRIKEGKIVSKFFFAAIVITLICFPYISSTAWGAFKAIVMR